MIEINGKVYRNIQEQVEKNKEDIESIQDSKQDNLTAGDGIDITDNTISVDDTKVVVKDSDGNVDGVLQVEHLQSESWEEDDDCKADIYLNSGLRRGRVTISAGGEESSASIILQGTTSISSEGYIEINGETTFNTVNRIQVDNGDTIEEVAYLSDIPSTPAGGGNVVIINYGDTTIDLATIFGYLSNGYDLIVREYAAESGTEIYTDYKFESASVNANNTRYQFDFYNLNGDSSYFVSQRVRINNYTDPNVVSWDYQATRIL